MDIIVIISGASVYCKDIKQTHPYVHTDMHAKSNKISILCTRPRPHIYTGGSRYLIKKMQRP